MSRLHADILLMLTALIWGFAFVAQKTAMDDIGIFTFIAGRFALSFIVILPLVFREQGRRQQAEKWNIGTTVKGKGWPLVFLCGAFFTAVALQQVGIVYTTVTNTGFLTGLTVLFTPVIAWGIFKMHPKPIVWIAAPVSVVGVYLLGEGGLNPLGAGDFLVIAAAVFFALHIVLIGDIAPVIRRPILIAALQYGSCALMAFIAALATETVSWAGLNRALPALLYAGICSGGIAYTLQIIAQQHTPPSDAAIILSAEALFAAFAGVLVMSDHLSLSGWLGCGLIFVAILMVELVPRWRARRQQKQ